MMPYVELASDDAAFSQLRKECEAVFDLKKRLPELVFKRQFKKYYVFTEVIVHSARFSLFLHGLSTAFRDASVRYMSVEPDPVDYYFKHFSFYGLASFKAGDLINEDRYSEVMSRGGEIDSFNVRGGDVGVFWGSSLEWGIVCDRISWDLCILGAFNDIDPSILGLVEWFDEAQIASFVKENYRKRPSVALDFIKNFGRNYPGLEGKKTAAANGVGRDGDNSKN